MVTTLFILSLGVMPIFAAHSTVVTLTDIELYQILPILYSHLGGSNIIPITLLKELGFYTPSIVSYLISIGFSIIY